MTKQVVNHWLNSTTINQKGGVWAGWFTFIMLCKLIMVCFFRSPDFTSGSLTVYGTVIGTYGLTRLGAKMVNGKSGHPVDED
jgi:hypothetical protein